jgi:hypothetical protein
LGLEVFEELSVVGVGQRRQLGHQAPAGAGERQRVGPPVLWIVPSLDERLGAQPVGKLGDRAAAHPHPLGQLAGRHGLDVVQVTQQDPFGDGHAVGLHLASEGQGDVVGHVTQPIPEVVGQLGGGLGAGHG